MKKVALSVKFLVSMVSLLIIASIGSAFTLAPLIRNSVLHADYLALDNKEKLVTKIIDEDEQSMLSYLQAIKDVSPLFTDFDEFVNYLENYAKNFGLFGVALIQNSGKIAFSSTDSNFRHASEMRVISRAKSNVDGVVKTVTNDSLYFTSAGRVRVLDTPYVLVFQKKISDTKYLESLGERTSTSLSLFIGDKCVGTNNKSKSGKYLTGTFSDQEVLDVVYNQRQTYKGQVGFEDNSFLAIYRPYITDNPADRVMFFVGTDVNHVDSDAGTITFSVMVAVCICLLIVIILVLVILSKTVIQPVKHLHNAFDSIIRDDGSIDLTYDVKVTSNDEIGEMQEDLSKFLQNQLMFMKNVKGATELLGKSSENLAANAQETAGATTEIAANISSVQTSVVKQNEALQSVHNVLDSNIEGIQVLDELISEQSAGIVESSAAIEEMVGNIDSVSKSVSKMTEEYAKLLSITNTAKARQEEVSTSVNKMSEQSEKLANANHVIAQIASQTNLLAMNAAIEAAHAGDAGKGFSVVADEIRKLAEDSSKQSKAIQAELKSISTVISEVVNSTEVSRKEFDDILLEVTSTNSLVSEISSAMNEQEEASKQVLIALRDMNESTSTVSSTSKEMAEHGLVLKHESGKLEQIAQIVQGSMEEMDAGVKEISISTVSVSDLCTTTRDKVREVDQLMEKFII